ncbi:MAG: tetraacyldisaccharide 4'-kinase, partial [Pseudomonadota bacterium]
MKAPYFWSAGLDPSSRDAAPVTRKILTPLAWLYAQLTARRLRKTKPVKVDAVVICVGNLTAGGTGKSPIVQYVRDAMTEQTGLRVASLSRGYGGILKGPLRVDPDCHSAAEVGDEPLMLAQKGESWIGRDRALAGHAMAADGIELIVMDDGHQNPSLHKDLSIIVIDTEAGFGNGYVIPKGPLREPAPIGLSRADLVIAMGNQTLPDSVQASGKAIYKAQLTPTDAAPAGKLVAFAGIGRPEKFFDSLRALDCDLVD